MKNLKELREYLNSIPNINKGGCLISAYSMYLYLKKTNQLPDGFKIIQIAQDDTQRFFLLRNLQSSDPTKYTAGCDHAMCQVDGIIFDSDESRPIDIDIVAMASSVAVNPETQSAHIIAQINTDRWNNSFNREKHIPEIQRELGIDLSMLKLKFSKEDKREANKIIEDEQERVYNAVSDYREMTGKHIVGSPLNTLQSAILRVLS